MKVVVLNGNPNAENTGFDEYLSALKSRLEEKGHVVDLLMLRDMDLRYCVGCFGCWVKTPGRCVTPDASHDTDRRVINSDVLLLASPLSMGFVSSVLKKAQDKFIGLLLPYIELVKGECHHLKRYEHYPYLGVLVEREADSDDEDLEITREIYERTCLNLKTSLRLFETTESPAVEVADAIDGL